MIFDIGLQAARDAACDKCFWRLLTLHSAMHADIGVDWAAENCRNVPTLVQESPDKV